MSSSSGAFNGAEPESGSESEPESKGSSVESQHASGASTSEESAAASGRDRGERQPRRWGGGWEPLLEDFDLSCSSESETEEEDSDAEGLGLPKMPRLPRMLRLPSLGSSTDSESGSETVSSSFESGETDEDSDEGEWEPEHFMLYLLQGRLKEPLDSASREMTAVWTLLPEELLERVFAMTPLASQCRFRVVSRAWRKRLSSLAFRQLCSSIPRPPGREPVICALEHMPRSRPVLRSDLSLWGKAGNLEVLRVDASYLPAKFRACHSSMVVQAGLVCICSTGDYGGIREPSASLTASHQATRSAAHTAESRIRVGVVGLSFCVVNPVAAAWKELPAEPYENDGYEQRTFEGNWRVILEVDKGMSGNFKVIVVSIRPSMLWRSKHRATLSVYSSSTDAWEVIHLTSPYPSQKCLAYGREEDLRRWPLDAICQDQLFTMDGPVLYVHNLTTGTFVNRTVFRGLESFGATLLGHHSLGEEFSRLGGLRSVCGIFSYCQRLFCVGEGLVSKVQQCGVWELDKTVSLWYMTSFLPVKLENEVMSRRLNRMCMHSGTLVGDTIWLTFHLSSSRLVGAPHKHTVLIGYHFPSDSWNLKSKGWPAEESLDSFKLLQPGNLGFEQCVQAAMSSKVITRAEENDVNVIRL